nr:MULTISPECIES: fatty acid desaturase [Arthrobacter]
MEKAPFPAENPGRRQHPNQVVNSYVALLGLVRDAGLLRRRRGFYIILFTILMAAWAGAWAGFFLLEDTWFQLLIAAGMGVVLTQLGFLAHEAAHRQVFASKAMNEWSARLIGTGLVGISYAMWVQKHTPHHNHPEHDRQGSGYPHRGDRLPPAGGGFTSRLHDPSHAPPGMAVVSVAVLPGREPSR